MLNLSLRSQCVHWLWQSATPVPSAPLPKGGWHGEAVTGGFLTAPLVKDAGRRGRRPLRNPIGKHSVGATLAVARERGRAPLPYAPQDTLSLGPAFSTARPGFFPHPRQGTRALPYKNVRLQGGAHVSRRTLRFLLTVSLPGCIAPVAIRIFPRQTKREHPLGCPLGAVH